jgi:hypothetical protein
MNKSRINEYLKSLEKELRIRGLSTPDTLAEVESHLYEARDLAIKRGLDQQEAQQQALDRFGSAHFVARRFELESRTMKQKVLLVISLVFGLFVAYIDSRPTWNDTGITVFALLIGSGIIGLLLENKPWLFALAIGLWLPLWYIITTSDLSMIIVLAFPFIGVYMGWLMRLGLHKLRHAS